MFILIFIQFFIVFASCAIPNYQRLLQKVKAAGDDNYCGKAPGVQSSVQRQANPNVKQVVVVMRHGDRTSFGWYHPPG